MLTHILMLRIMNLRIVIVTMLGVDMPVNLLNEKDLNTYLTDVVYMGAEMPEFKNGNFQSIAYVRQNKDAIVRAILSQYMKHRLRSYLIDKEDLPFLLPIEKTPDLPGWAERALEEGQKIFRFDASQMTTQMQEEINTIRDFLYSAGESYVDKTLATAEHTKQAPKLRLDYLKTSNEYSTFDKTLEAAKKWHEVMAERAEQLSKSKELFEKSLQGTEFVMDLPNGMAAYRLTTPEALDFESEYMGHCVGKGSYDEGVTKGIIQIYSIRDKNGEPHATFAVRNNDIYQCKGKGNKAPVARYRPAVQEFVRQKRFNIKRDSAHIALIQQDGEYYDIYNLPKGFLVKGDLRFSDPKMTELPDLSTITVQGSFDCSGTQITSLKGAPQEVGGDFDCSITDITSLKGAPQKVGGDFDCVHTQITSLEGAPQEVTGHFDCSYNRKIISLKGAPQKVGRGFCCSNTPITSFEGAPQEVGEEFYCSNTPITSLEGAPQKVGGGFCCSETQITSLKGAPQEVGGDFDCDHTKITSLEGIGHVGENINYRYTPFDYNNSELKKKLKEIFLKYSSAPIQNPDKASKKGSQSQRQTILLRLSKWLGIDAK